MKTSIFTAALLLLSSPVLSHPQPITDIQLVERDTSFPASSRDVSDPSSLFKRKGGGGKGGKGGSSSSGSSSTSSSSGSSAGKGSTTSSTGGATKQGSGVQPSFAGGKYYGGGATTPYSSGVRSPLGIAPVFLGVAALSVFPGIWLYGAYSYPYTHRYTFHNRTATNSTTNSTNTRRDTLDHFVNLLLRQDTTTGENQTKPVDCLCAQYAECGCDDSGDTSFLDSVVGDGTYATLNKSIVNVVDVNGTSTIVLNGTLENGTTTAGGTEDANAAMRTAQSSGYFALVAMVGFMVYFI